MKPDDIKHMHPKLAPDAAAVDAPMDTHGPSPDDERLDLIAEAHTRVLDTISGFAKLAEKAEPHFKPVAEEFLTTHSKHGGELAGYLARCGRNPEQDGSIFGAVNRAVIEMRSWFEDVGDNVMDRVKTGEKHVLDAYEDARNAGQTVEANAMLVRHMQEIDALLVKHVP